MAHSCTFFVSMKEAKPAHGLPASKKAKKEKWPARFRSITTLKGEEKMTKAKAQKTLADQVSPEDQKAYDALIQKAKEEAEEIEAEEQAKIAEQTQRAFEAARCGDDVWKETLQSIATTDGRLFAFICAACRQARIEIVCRKDLWRLQELLRVLGSINATMFGSIVRQKIGVYLGAYQIRCVNGTTDLYYLESMSPIYYDKVQKRYEIKTDFRGKGSEKSWTPLLRNIAALNDCTIFDLKFKLPEPVAGDPLESEMIKYAKQFDRICKKYGQWRYSKHAPELLRLLIVAREIWPELKIEDQGQDVLARSRQHNGKLNKVDM